MLKVCAPSPPVPQVSTASGGDHLVQRLAARAQRCEERGDLQVARPLRHDRAHDLVHLGARETLALERAREHRAHR